MDFLSNMKEQYLFQKIHMPYVRPKFELNILLEKRRLNIQQMTPRNTTIKKHNTPKTPKVKVMWKTSNKIVYYSCDNNAQS